MRPATYFFLLFGVFAFSNCGTPDEKKWEITSPDGSIKLVVSVLETGGGKTYLQYEVATLKNNKSTAVIEASPLGINREDQQFAENLSFVSKTPVQTIDEKYHMLIGHQTESRNYAKELGLTFKNENGALVELVLRAYNDGVAFKYVFPEKANGRFKVNQELTGFNLPENGKVWIQRFDKAHKYGPAYELYYENGIPIGTPSPHEEGWAFPALFHTNGHYVLISEANLSENYCGVRLEQNAANGLYRVRFPNAGDALGTGQVEPISTLPWTMPWRTIIIGSSLGTIYESNMINDLSDPAKGDFTWVKPGRSSWSWNTSHDSPKNYQALKEFVDLSADMKWEYSLVDANWDLMQGGNIAQLAKYADSKNVGLLLWYNSGGPHNEVTERPRDIMSDPQKRKEEFKKIRDWGVKGVKIDFWHSDKQNLIALYLDVIKDAAQEQILVNFHGCTIPRGWSRTYPNLVAMEAVKGEENYEFDPTFPAENVIQNSILPFTRNVIGPLDYTPLTLTNLKYPHLTTYAHELALTLLFNSGILHFGDSIEKFRSLPTFVQDFLKEVPVTFDETHFIAGEPGKSAIIASRKGKVWYAAGINSEKNAKDFKMELPFLEKGTYQLNLITDGPEGKSFQQEAQIYKSDQPLSLTLPAYGGFVATFKQP